MAMPWLVAEGEENRAMLKGGGGGGVTKLKDSSCQVQHGFSARLWQCLGCNSKQSNVPGGEQSNALGGEGSNVLSGKCWLLGVRSIKCGSC